MSDIKWLTRNKIRNQKQNKAKKSPNHEVIEANALRQSEGAHKKLNVSPETINRSSQQQKPNNPSNYAIV